MKNSVRVVASVGWCSKIITAFQQLFLIKIIISNSGDVGYAGFILVYGLMVWFQLLDLGYGFASQNKISASDMAIERCNNVRYSIITVVAFFVLFCLAIQINCANIFFEYISNASGLNRSESNDIFYTLMPIVLASSLSFFVVKLFFATGDGLNAHLFNLLNGTFTLVSVIIFKPNGLYATVLSYYLPQMTLTLCALTLLWIKQKGVRIKLSEWIEFVKILFKPAVSLWVFAILSAMVLQIDYLILSKYCTSEEIVTYSTVYKVYGVAVFVISALLQANWPRISKLHRERAFDKIESTAKETIVIGLILVVGYGLAFILFHEMVSDYFGIGTSLRDSLIVLLMLYFMCRVVSDTYAMIMQSTDKANYLIIVVIIQALISIPLQMLFGRLYTIDGIVLSLIITFMATSVWMLPVLYYKKCKI